MNWDTSDTFTDVNAKARNVTPGGIRVKNKQALGSHKAWHLWHYFIIIIIYIFFY